jgi:hypothetical protein
VVKPPRERPIACWEGSATTTGRSGSAREFL